MIRNFKIFKKSAMVGYIISFVIYSILLSLLIYTATATANPFENCAITDRQASVLYFSYNMGEPHDLGYTLAAIAMRESHLGRWNVATGENSFSPWHVRIMHVIHDKGWPRGSQFHRNMAAQILLDDWAYAANLAIGVYQHWYERNGTWRGALSGYNGGTRGNPRYVKEIIENIEIIRRCGWLDNMNTTNLQ